jgi:hypothetical protein
MSELTPTIRPAQLRDLLQVYAVLYENDVAGNPQPPPPRSVPPYLHHVLNTGTMYVAEQSGQVLAFTGLIQRGHVAFLTDLFVRPHVHSSHLGTALLRKVLPRDAPIRCTMSSTDPRAMSLYVRAGMQPQWPHFGLRAQTASLDALPPTGVEVREAQPDDPELAQWDAAISGRPRPEELTFWVRKKKAVPLWFWRSGETVGYGYVRLSGGTLWDPDAVTIGPIGARRAEHSAHCVLAAAEWARQRASVLRVSVPGPHPSLAPLLKAHFQIRFMETFMSSAAEPFFDARRYLTSGSDLL